MPCDLIALRYIYTTNPSHILAIINYYVICSDTE